MAQSFFNSNDCHVVQISSAGIFQMADAMMVKTAYIQRIVRSVRIDVDLVMTFENAKGNDPPDFLAQTDPASAPSALRATPSMAVMVHHKA